MSYEKATYPWRAKVAHRAGTEQASRILQPAVRPVSVRAEHGRARGTPLQRPVQVAGHEEPWVGSRSTPSRWRTRRAPPFRTPGRSAAASPAWATGRSSRGCAGADRALSAATPRGRCRARARSGSARRAPCRYARHRARYPRPVASAVRRLPWMMSSSVTAPPPQSLSLVSGSRYGQPAGGVPKSGIFISSPPRLADSCATRPGAL